MDVIVVAKKKNANLWICMEFWMFIEVTILQYVYACLPQNPKPYQIPNLHSYHVIKSSSILILTNNKH